jgi:enoyl-CoA hydratase/carnithine racemase
MAELVTIEKSGGVADVRLNRPEKYNALNPEMFTAIVAAGESLRDDPSVRVVVLSGNGRGFCAGLDFQSFQGMAEGGRSAAPAAEQMQTGRDTDAANRAQRPALVWKRLPVPVIAAVHGVAYGGGLQIALGADVRIAGPDARFSVMEIKWGLVPDMSLTQTIRELVALDVAKELTFTGRVVDAREAQALGLVTRVADDPLAAALALAEEIAAKSPDAIRAGKRLLEEAWYADAAAGLKLEAALQGSLIGGDNQREAVKANFENRVPRFKDSD